MMRGLIIIVLCAATWVLPCAARAEWSPPALLSLGSGEQAFGAPTASGSVTPDISEDGRYVVFTTSARNVVAFPESDPAFFRRGGIVRRDLTTGVNEVVASGDRVRVESPFSTSPQTLGASTPSVSADGRFVAFHTNEALVAADTNGSRDVYVRDMAVPIGATGAYDLVSAQDGSDLPGTYTGAVPANVGARAAKAGEAISDDGDTVLFWTDAPVTLTAAGSAPAGQLFLRRRAADRTIAVNTLRDPVTGTPTAIPAGGAARGVQGASAQQVPAALSADGSTIVWLSTSAPDRPQTRGLTPETSAAGLFWRRVADPDGQIRQVTGAEDPENPACPADGSVSSAGGQPVSPCDGPLARPADENVPLLSLPPTISGDGRRVAFVTSWPARTQPESQKLVRDDVMVVDMAPGRSRTSALREITRSEPVASPGFTDVALAAGGGTLAVVARGLRLRLETPRLVGVPPADVDEQQLYAVDLTSDVIDVASRGVEGASPDDPGSVWSPSLRPDGRRIVFSSRAANLVSADGNGLADIFAVDRVDASLPLASQSVPPGPAPIVEAIQRRLRVTATSLRDGRVRVTVVAPGAGRVSVAATALPGQRLRGAARRVAAADRTVRAAGVFRFLLRPNARARRVLPKAGMNADVRVGFRPAAGRTGLSRTVPAIFRRPVVRTR